MSSKLILRRHSVFIQTTHNNHKRALEDPIASTDNHVVPQQDKKSPYNYINIALDIDRKILHKRIEQRFKKMLDEGFVEEVKKLYAHPQIHEQLPAIKSLGYQQVWLYLDGKYTYDEMVEKTVIATRQFAKRQFTWLRAWSNITWFNALDEHLVPKVESALKW